MKKYKAIFFDWDGTAVVSRKAPANEAVAAMKPLLEQGTKLVIVSGTTYENIAEGNLEQMFSKEELANLYLGLGRGAYNYAYDLEGKPYLFEDKIPAIATLLGIHQICFEIHQELLEKHGLETDIVFSRPNYCKIDLMVNRQRGDHLFLQENEVDLLKQLLKDHGITNGLQGMIDLAIETGKKHGIEVEPTCDAKYLEVGISSKSDNVNCILQKLNQEYAIKAEDCTFWGDEYVGIESGIYGSDSFMLTEQTKAGTFFDVSEVSGERPEQVSVVGGGVERFLRFLREQGQQ